ncbi:MAG: hypothetical protein EOM03_14160 [Clostridia bacterium]|nr:hypothetical protein [Clostridia bacterium]
MEKRHTIRMSPDTIRRLKVLAARSGLSQGCLLQHFLRELQDDGRELTAEEISQAARVVNKHYIMCAGNGE